MAGPLYVTPDELTALVGVGADTARLSAVCESASRVVDHYYGTATVNARLRLEDGTTPVDPIPDVVREATLTIAADLWRRPTTPGGYFQVVDYVGRLAQDPRSSVVALLDSLGRVAWPIS